MFNWRMYE